jgi:membrane protein
MVTISRPDDTAQQGGRDAAPKAPQTRSFLGSLAFGAALIATIAFRGASGRRPTAGETPAEPPQSTVPGGSGTITSRDVPSTRSSVSLLWRLYEAAYHHRVMLIAAGVTFYALLALFPAVAALVSLYGLFADPDVIKQQLESWRDIFPAGAIEIISDQVSRIQARGGGELGVYFFSGLAISLWSANAGIKGIFDALNAVHGESEKRSFLRYNLQALAFTLGMIVFVMVAITAIVVMPAVFAFFGLASTDAAWVLSVLRWPLLLFSTLLLLALIYRFGPSLERPTWRWITWGSLTATILWIATSMIFTWYVASFSTFNQTYGSLGAVVGFMMWIWLSAMIILIGAEIDELRRRGR